MRTLSGNENFWFDGMPLPHLVGDFWAWSSSDLLKGTLRGALAEFIVATAIGENTSEAHEDRQAWDLEMICGGGVCKIEVKSSAYINAGARDGLSSVSFSIAPSRRSELGKKVLDKDQARRASDVYVFCLFASKDREAANPLILDDWQFIVIPTPTLDWSCPGQKTISLRSLLKLRSASVDYGNLAPAIEAANRAAKDIRDYIQSFLPPPIWCILTICTIPPSAVPVRAVLLLWFWCRYCLWLWCWLWYWLWYWLWLRGIFHRPFA